MKRFRTRKLMLRIIFIFIVLLGSNTKANELFLGCLSCNISFDVYLRSFRILKIAIAIVGVQEVNNRTKDFAYPKPHTHNSILSPNERVVMKICLLFPCTISCFGSPAIVSNSTYFFSYLCALVQKRSS